MKNKLFGVLTEQQDLQETLKDIRKDMEIVQSMDSTFSDLLKHILLQGGDKSILQENWKQELKNLKSQIAQLQVKSSKSQNLNFFTIRLNCSLKHKTAEFRIPEWYSKNTCFDFELLLFCRLDIVRRKTN